MKINSIFHFLFICLITTLFFACDKDSYGLSTVSDVGDTKDTATVNEEEYLPETIITNNFGEWSISDNDFYEISEALYNYLVDAYDESVTDIETKSSNLRSARDLMNDTIKLCQLMQLHRDYMLVDSIHSRNFFLMLLEHKETITHPDFKTVYLAMLDEKKDESRWFLGTLAGLLGASPCTQSAMHCLDACAGVAMGILTAPTGIGAVACWGAAAASYAAAIATPC